MNMKDAAYDTIALAVRNGMHMMSSDKSDADYPHLVHMAEKIQNEEMSEGKMGRWLGWMQACVYIACENVTLDDLKQINRNNSGD